MNTFQDTLNEILWGRFPDVERVFSIPRSTTYDLINEGLIRSRLLRQKGQRGSGVRLIDMQSVRDYIESCPQKTPKAIRTRMRECGFASGSKAEKKGEREK
jgi:hypothetical protein